MRALVLWTDTNKSHLWKCNIFVINKFILHIYGVVHDAHQPKKRRRRRERFKSEWDHVLMYACVCARCLNVVFNSFVVILTDALILCPTKMLLLAAQQLFYHLYTTIGSRKSWFISVQWSSLQLDFVVFFVVVVVVVGCVCVCFSVPLITLVEFHTQILVLKQWNHYKTHL